MEMKVLVVDNEKRFASILADHLKAAVAICMGLHKVMIENDADLVEINPLAIVREQGADGPQESLPLFVYRNIKKPDLSAVSRGFAGALVLMIIVVALFLLARFIGRDRSKKSGRRSRRIVAPASPMPNLVVRGEPGE